MFELSLNKGNISKVIYKIKESIKVDKEKFTSLVALKTMDPFKLLIATILSQNTNDKNSIKAYCTLEEKIGIKPHRLLSASEQEIMEAIKIGGLYRQKARAIKEISKYLIENYNGDLKKLLSLPPNEARKKLLELPKVGYKTADVLLLFVRNYPFFPVDTHITRISKRLGIVNQNAKYEDIRLKWQELLNKNQYFQVHILLIEFGRQICKAKNPLCTQCKIREFCKYIRTVKN